MSYQDHRRKHFGIGRLCGGGPPAGLGNSLCFDCGGTVKAPWDVDATVANATGCLTVNGSSTCCYNSGTDPAKYFGDVGGVGYTADPHHEAWFTPIICTVDGYAVALASTNYVHWNAAAATVCEFSGSMGVADDAAGTCNVAGTFTVTAIRY